MSEYIIMTDSSCDLPFEMINKLQISVLPLSFLMDEQKYYNYPDERDITFAKFYDLLRHEKMATTSAVNLSDFENEMEPYLKDGKDILFLGMSSALSCTYNNSVAAANELKEKYPERKIYVVDTLSASLGQGLLVYLAVLEKQKGKNLEEVRDFVENIKLRICHWFTVEDLGHLKRGGRVSAATALIGGMLGIKPILHVDNLGRLINVSKVRGRKTSMDELANRLKNSIINPEEQTVFISHGDCKEDADYLTKIITEQVGVKNVITAYIGPVIGAHAGPGTISVFFIGNER